jgi:hypothetical protein
VDATLAGVAEADEEAPGGFLADRTTHTNALRTMLTLSACGPSGAAGNLVLSWNSSVVSIYTEPTGGTALEQFIKPFSGFNGTNLYVEGIAPGSNTLSWSYSGQSDCVDTIRATILKVDLKEVSFSGDKYHVITADDESETYTAPHWVDNSNQLNGNADDPGDVKRPVAFTRNTKPKVSAKWIVQPSGLNVSFKLKGQVPNCISFPSTIATLNGNELTITGVESAAAFVNEVSFFDPLEISWQFSVDNGATWLDAGTSDNQVYVTLSDPLTTVYHTLAHLGCKNAQGETTEANTTAKIWQEFTDRDVRRVDGLQLTYYTSYLCSYITTADLLTHGDGQCGAWAKLFLDMRKVQGIADTDEYVIFLPIPPPGIPQEYVGFIVKNWTFTGVGSSGHTNYPYFNLPDNPFIGTSSYNWRFAEVNEANGIPGQGNPNPASMFNNHQVVISGEYYDPSYGVKYQSLDDIDDTAIAGYYLGPVLYPVDEPVVDLDLNGNGNKTDLQIDTPVILFRKNPVGLDLHELRITY